VNIGSRQVGRERGPNVVDCTYDRDEIVAAITRQLDAKPIERTDLYGDGEAGGRIADLLATVPLTIDKRLAY
jgi:hypothetical protein